MFYLLSPTIKKRNNITRPH